MQRIRTATADDIGLIRELTFAIWPVTYGSIISQEQLDYMLDMMYSPASLAKQMTEEDCTFIIIQDDEQPVGFASYSEEKLSIWKLNKIYILPSQQGRGTGRYAIDYIVTEIRAKGATALQLQVNRANTAKDFYEKLGFTIIQTADFEIGNGYFMNDYVMELKV